MASTLPQVFLERIRQTPNAEAFRFPQGTGWGSLSWGQVGTRVTHIAHGLRALGLAAEERAAILSGTRIEWILADLGILCAGGATTTIYPSSTPDDCAYILSDAGAVVVFAEGAAHVKKLLEKRERIPQVRAVIVFDGAGVELVDPSARAQGHPYREGEAPAWDGKAISLQALEAFGAQQASAQPAAFEQWITETRPDSLATLIYTSGTTGQPKGVQLLQSCWVSVMEATVRQNIMSQSDLQYLWLPMAHSFGKVLEAVQIRLGFCTAIDGRIDKIVDNLAVVRPTVVAAVPRIFEKVYNRVSGQAKQAGGLKYRIFTWALGVGRRVSALQQKGAPIPAPLSLQYSVADRLVFSKLRERFGGRLRFFLSGSAPLSREISEFFHAAGILILEGYGLTETSAAGTVNRPDRYKFGTVGLPLPGVEIKIAEDGEILLKGPNVMRGYHNLSAATSEVLTPEGWLMTGDIGELDADGFLRITDRKKDLIKTSGGKYVAPQALEGKLKAACPLISQVLVHGNNRNFCSALVAIEEEAGRKWASEQGLSVNSYAELVALPQLKAAIKEQVDALNATLASYETIKRFAILPQDMSEAGGDLTASLKMKRKAIEQKYKTLLDNFYTEARD